MFHSSYIFNPSPSMHKHKLNNFSKRNKYIDQLTWIEKKLYEQITIIYVKLYSLNSNRAPVKETLFTFHLSCAGNV